MSKTLKKILCLALSLSMLALAGCTGTEETKKQDSDTSLTEKEDKAKAQKKENTEDKSKDKPEEKEKTEKAMDKTETPDKVNIRITLTNGKQMEAELYPKIAPKTVENFVKLINEKFYDGLIFHRVIEGFMIQGGGFDESFYDGNFNTKEADTIKGEFTSNGYKNALLHKRGVLSMARTNDPNSASSQFFIMHQDSPHLDGDYAAFGKVTKGLEVVDEIATGRTTALEGTVLYMGQEYPQQMTDVPETPVVIKTIEIID